MNYKQAWGNGKVMLYAVPSHVKGETDRLFFDYNDAFTYAKETGAKRLEALTFKYHNVAVVHYPNQ